MTIDKTALEQLRYPIGQFVPPAAFDTPTIQGMIQEIEQLPTQIAVAVEGFTDEQLDTPYRPGGWTVRQVIQHLIDSHMNSFIRFKLTLTEDKPEIRPYEQDEWCDLLSTRTMPLTHILPLLEGLHKNWVFLLESLTDEQWKRTLLHPEIKRTLNLEFMLALYAWHGKHHLAQITGLKAQKNWA